MLRTTPRRRQRKLSEGSNRHKIQPHIVLSRAEQFFNRFTTSHLFLVVILAFLFIFGSLALLLPSESTKREFVNMQVDDPDPSSNDAMKPRKPNKINVDPEGHVQIFYYPWYGNPEHDGQFIHWNHDILPHWEKKVNEQYEIGKEYDPLEDEIGASFYPSLGPYSSSDPAIIAKHFEMLLNANISVIVVSWHSPIVTEHNEKDKITANNLDLLFESAANYGMRIAIHLEPYNGRTAQSTYRDLEYLHSKYAKSESYYTSSLHGGKPFFYVYDSYKMENDEWRKLFVKGVDDSLCVRDTDLDGIFLGLYLNKNPSESHIERSGFDGFYTYFAANGFTEGSSLKNWNRMARWAVEKELIFVPSIGPGYHDLRVRPWNNANTKERNKNGIGEYYKSGWNEVFKINQHLERGLEIKKKRVKHPLIKKHLEMNKDDDISPENEEKEDMNHMIANVDQNSMDKSPVIQYASITSFNEWHEGTQIEPSIVKQSKNGYKYLDFEREGGPDSYLKMTKEVVGKFLNQF